MRDAKGRFPPGWDEAGAQGVIAHYEAQAEDQALAEDEAALADASHAVMIIPKEPVPAVRAPLAESSGPEAAAADSQGR